MFKGAYLVRQCLVLHLGINQLLLHFCSNPSEGSHGLFDYFHCLLTFITVHVTTNKVPKINNALQCIEKKIMADTIAMVSAIIFSIGVR